MYVTEPEFKTMVTKAAVLVRGSGRIPRVLIGLSYGGYAAAVGLGKRLHIPSEQVIGLPAGKTADNVYYLGDLVSLNPLAGADTLVIDDSCNRGELLERAADYVIQVGGIPRTCVLIASNMVRPARREPTFVVEKRDHVPDFFWDDL